MTERQKHAADRSAAQSQSEDDEIANFNQNTGYDDRSSLKDTEEGLTVNDGLTPSVEDWIVQTFIQTSRCYDVLMTLLQAQDADRARDLLELHMQGHLLGPTPRLTGLFLTDEMNSEDSGEQQDREENLHAGEFDDTKQVD